MTEYTCNICNKIFQRKDHLTYHIKKEACKNRKTECRYCHKLFTTSANMYRHMKYSCKIKRHDDNEKENILNRLLQLENANKELAETSKKEIILLQNENIILKKKVDNLEKNTNLIPKETNTTNINNGIINNILLVGYGHEDISKIDRDDMVKALQNGFNSTVKLTETMHFNPKYPEYHNIYISNMKDKYAMTYDGTDWNLTIKEDLINKIYDDKKNYIEDNLDDFVKSLTVFRKKALDRWLETDDDDIKITKIKNEIKLLLYNKRNLIDQNKKNKKENILLVCKKN